MTCQFLILIAIVLSSRALYLSSLKADRNLGRDFAWYLGHAVSLVEGNTADVVKQGEYRS